MTWNQYIEEGTGAVRRGDHAAAEKSLKAALAFAKENFSRSDSRLALTLSLLGHVYFKVGDYIKSEKLLEQSLKLHSQSEHLNDPCLLMDLFTLAEIKQAGGKKVEAFRLYDETLSRVQCKGAAQSELIQQANLRFRELADQIRPATTNGAGEEKPIAVVEPKPAPAPAPASTSLPLPKMEFAEVGSAGDVWQQQFQNGLASMKMDDAECDELITAYLNFESAFRLASGMFAKDDMRLIATTKGLADASTRLRMFDQAEALYHEAINRTRSNTANAAAAGNSIRLALGLMYVEACMFKQARTIFDEESIEGLPKEAQHLRKRLEEAVRVLKVYQQAEHLLSQAEIADGLGDFDKAAKLANNAVSQLKQAFSPTHIENARLLRYRASMLEKCGNHEQAEELIARANRIERNHAAEEEEWRRRTAELPKIELDAVLA